MNAQKTRLKDEQKRVKQMFHELFQIQILLSKFENSECTCQDEIKITIQIVDELMQFLMDRFDS